MQGATTDKWRYCGACFVFVCLHTPKKNLQLESKLSHFWVTNQIPDAVICSEHVSGVGTGRRAFHQDIVWCLPTGFV